MQNGIQLHMRRVLLPHFVHAKQPIIITLLGYVEEERVRQHLRSIANSTMRVPFILLSLAFLAMQSRAIYIMSQQTHSVYTVIPYILIAFSVVTSNTFSTVSPLILATHSAVQGIIPLQQTDNLVLFPPKLLIAF
jgi:hypothetical protein